MKQYIGNCSDVIDWNAVVDSVANSKPAYQGPRHTRNDDLPGIKEISEAWDKGRIHTGIRRWHSWLGYVYT